MKLGLRAYKTEVNVQKIDGSRLDNFGMVIASYLMEDKKKRSCFFEKTFLLVDKSIDSCFGNIFPHFEQRQDQLYWSEAQVGIVYHCQSSF